MNTENIAPEFYGLPVFRTGLTLGELDLSGGVVFWDEATRFTAQAQVEQVLEGAVTGKPVPRVWVIMDESTNTESRTAAALSLARMLANRDQQVIIMDADDNRPDLTRWAGRAEREGWIDLLRYGASLTTSAVPLPWEGRGGYFLGVGSFCPTQATPEEVEQIITRLKRQTDDLIVSVAADETGLMWARHASVCFCCWDRLTRGEGQMQEMLAHIEQSGVTVDGILGFGFDEKEILEMVARLDPMSLGTQSDSETDLPADVLESDLAEIPESVEKEWSDDADSPMEPAAEQVSTDDDAWAPDKPGVEDEIVMEKTGSDETAREQPEWVAKAEDPAYPDPPPAKDLGPGEVIEDYPEKDADEEYVAKALEGMKTDHFGDGSAEENKVAGYPDLGRSVTSRRRTSPLFWGVAVALVLVLVVVGGWWVKIQFLDSAEQDPYLASTSSGPDMAAVDETSRSGMDVPVTSPELEPTGSDPGDIYTEPEQPPAATQESETPASITASDIVTGEPEDSFSPATSAGTPADVSDQPGDARSDRDPFTGVVGTDGWAVHLYSLADSTTARKQCAWLEGKGYAAIWKAEDIPDKGRWYRVYVGNFSSRQQAREAIPDLKNELGVDWAAPKRF